MQNAQPTAPARAGASCQDPHHSSAHHEGGDALAAWWPVRHQDDFAGAGSCPALGVCMIIPVTAAVVITCALSPAITFVVLRRKGYSRLTASLGVSAGGLGPLLAIAAPSRLPTS